MREEPFDIVLCVGPQHAEIAYKTVLGILTYFNYANIWIISNPMTLNKLKLTLPFNKQLIYLEEDKIIPEVSLEKLKEYFKRRDAQPSRAGWYYQQFLKMSLSLHCQSTHYLIWDADTIPLKRINFFKADKPLMHTSSEYHKPYFETLNNLLSLDKKIESSFITEHMLVDTAVMKMLIADIQANNSQKPWPITVLDAVSTEDLSKSGFSEYETYGTFVLDRHHLSFLIREQSDSLQTYRNGTQLFSPNPSYGDLKLLKDMGYHYVTFEIWDSQQEKNIRKNHQQAKLYSQLMNLKLSPLANWVLKRFRKKMEN